MREKQEREQQEVKLKSQEDLRRINDETRNTLARTSRTLMDNFERMEPWQQFAVGGLFAYVMWKAWKSDGKFLGLIPYSWVPTGLVGTYLYMRLIQGNDNALNDMAGMGQRGVNILGNLAQNGLRRLNVMGPPEGDRLLRELAVMHKFFDQRAFERIYPASVAFTALAEAKLGNIAAGFRTEAGGYTFTAPPGSQLHLELFGENGRGGICQRRGYNAAAVSAYMRNSSPQVTRAITSFFFVTGAQDPANREVVQRIEKARRDMATPTNPAPSYLDIAGPLRAEVLRIIGRGHLMAQTPPLSQQNFAQVIGSMMETPERERFQVDTSQTSDLLGSPRRLRERGLYTLGNTTPIVDAVNLAAERTAFKNQLVLGFTEWRGNMVAHGILNAASSTRVQMRVAEIVALVDAPHNKPLREVHLALERLKYYVMVAAHGSSSHPLTAEIIDRQILAVLPPPAVADANGMLDRLLRGGTDIIRGFNNLIRLDGRFYEPRNLNDVLTFLNADSFRTFGPLRSLNAQGFDHLRGRVTFYKQQFDRMRDRGGLGGIGADDRNIRRTAERMVDAPGSTLVGAPRFPDRATAITGVMNGLRQNATFAERVDERERMFATQVSTELLLAFITDHRTNGNHVLSERLADRVLSPTEMRNLDTFMGNLFTSTMGPIASADNVSLGYYGRLDAVDTIQDALKDDISVANLNGLDYDTAAGGNAALAATGRLMRAYLLINHTPPLAPPAAAIIPELQARMLKIGEKTELSWYRRYHAAGTAGIAAAPPPPPALNRADLRRLPHYQPAALRVIIQGLQTLGVGEAARGGALPAPPAAPVADPATPAAQPILRDSLERVAADRT